MLKLPTTEARELLAELVNRAAFQQERIVLTRHGKDIAVIISVDDLARLQALDAVDPAGAVPRRRRRELTPAERTEALARIQATMKAIQSQAAADVDDADIDAEIAAARSARRR